MDGLWHKNSPIMSRIVKARLLRIKNNTTKMVKQIKMNLVQVEGLFFESEFSCVLAAAADWSFFQFVMKRFCTSSGSPSASLLVQKHDDVISAHRPGPVSEFDDGGWDVELLGGCDAVSASP
jgi:hypothetical protein